MKVKNLNASSRKTKKKIREAFAELMHEKKVLANITVTDLAKRADITRSSFYTHYENIYEVASDIQNETLEVLIKNTEDLKSIEDFYHCIDEITKYLKQNENIYSMILTSNEVLLYAEHLIRLLSKKVDLAFDKSKTSTSEFNMVIYTYGCIHLIIKYFQKQTDSTLDDINQYMKNLAKKLFQ